MYGVQKHSPGRWKRREERRRQRYVFNGIYNYANAPVQCAGVTAYGKVEGFASAQTRSPSAGPRIVLKNSGNRLANEHSLCTAFPEDTGRQRLQTYLLTVDLDHAIVVIGRLVNDETVWRSFFGRINSVSFCPATKSLIIALPTHARTKERHTTARHVSLEVSRRQWQALHVWWQQEDNWKAPFGRNRK
jgi:hypothetical protein